MAEQIITNKDRLHFYSENEYNYNWDKPLVKHSAFFYKAWYPVAKAVVKFKFDIEFYGAENVPKEGGLLLAANHVAGLDPIAITYCLQNKGHMRTMRFMAKEEFFHVFYVRIPLMYFGGFPVKRGTSDRKSLEYSKKIVDNGQILLVFPQGTRDKERKRPGEAKGGIALLARETKSDVVPVSIYRSPEGEGRKKDKYVIRFGEVIPYEELGLGDKPKSKELRSATQLIMDKIGELWDKDGAK